MVKKTGGLPMTGNPPFLYSATMPVHDMPVRGMPVRGK